MAINDNKIKWQDEELNHLIRLRFDEHDFNEIIGESKCNLCQKQMKDDSHIVTCP